MEREIRYDDYLTFSGDSRQFDSGEFYGLLSHEIARTDRCVESLFRNKQKLALPIGSFLEVLLRAGGGSLVTDDF